MVCYILSVLAAGVVFLIRDKDEHLKSLNLMLLGGAVFGLVDHAWNNELFASPNIYNDLLLGIAIVAGIFGSWWLIYCGPNVLKRVQVA